MTSSIRQQVLDVLATETQAGPLSEKLFSLEGLFNQVAKTMEDRKQLLQDPLYRQAMARFMELQRSEVARFEKSLQGVKSPVESQQVQSPSSV